MAVDRIRRIESMLERTLTATEKERLGRIQNSLGLADNDALWDVVTALEYQRTFYEDLPQKIGATATEILQGITTAADKEAAAAQAHLTDSVVQQAQRLASKINYATLLPMGIAVLVCMMLFGCLNLWAGYCLGSRQIHDMHWMLRMPSGIVIGCLAMAGGLFTGIYAAREFSEGEGGWWKRMLAALAMLVGGAMLIALTL